MFGEDTLKSVFSGGANNCNTSFAVGNINGYDFIAYASGSKLVILSHLFQKIDAIECHEGEICCVSCSHCYGKIAVSIGNQIIFLEPIADKNSFQEYNWHRIEQSKILRDYSITFLVFDYFGTKLLLADSGNNMEMWGWSSESSQWMSNWQNSDHAPIEKLSFSNDGFFFASLCKGSTDVKIWFKRQCEDSIERISRFNKGSSIQFDFLTLHHSMPVIYFSWRQISSHQMAPGTVVNLMVTSAVNGIGRIWQQSVEAQSNFEITSHHRKNSFHQLRTKAFKRIKKAMKKDHGRWPLRNPSIADINVFASEIAVSHKFHMVQNIHLPSEDGPQTYHWLNNKKMAFNLQLNALILYNHSHCKCEYHEDRIVSGELSNTPSELLYNFLAEMCSTCHNLYTEISDLLKSWYNSSDLIFAVNHATGTFSIWQLKYLDTSLIDSMRSVESKLLSGPHQLFQSDRSECLSSHIQTFENHYYLLPNLVSSYPNCFDWFKMLREPCIFIVARHTDGTIYQLQANFQLQNNQASISNIIPVNRVCGHRYDIRSINHHPYLPLIVSIAFSPSGEKTEMILWLMDSPGYLYQKGPVGLHELARVNNFYPLSYDKVAWFPLRLPGYNSDKGICSPSSLFVVQRDNKFLICQAVVDVRSHLSQVQRTSHQPILISKQSAMMSGAILKLKSIKDNQKENGKTIFMHIYYKYSVTNQTTDVSSYYSQNLDTAFARSYILVLITQLDGQQLILEAYEIIVAVDNLKETPFIVTPSVTVKRISRKHFSCNGSTLIDIKPTSDHKASIYFSRFMVPPYLFALIFADGEIRLWQSSMTSYGIEFCPVKNLFNIPQLTDSINIFSSISFAYDSRLAFAKLNVDSPSLQVGVWESESSGGFDWNLEALVNVDPPKINDNLNPRVNLEWLPTMNGSHILVVMTNSTVYFFSENFSIPEKWVLIKQVTLAQSRNMSLFTICLDGSLMIANGNETVLYRPQIDETDVFSQSRLHTRIKPLYHPTQLVAFLNLGKTTRVNKILCHLLESIDRAVREKAESPFSIPVLPLHSVADEMNDEEDKSSDNFGNVENLFADDDESMWKSSTDSLNLNSDDASSDIRIPDENPPETQISAGFTMAQAKRLGKYLEKIRLKGLTEAEHRELKSFSECCAHISSKIQSGLDLPAVRFCMALFKAKCHNSPMEEDAYAWAYFSEYKEEMLNYLPGVAEGNLTWEEFRDIGSIWWIAKIQLLRKYIELIARSHFKRDSDPLDVAIYYLALKKKSVIRSLYKSKNDSRMEAFFSNDFENPRWKEAAVKNAFVLLSKNRYIHSAVFFMLAGDLKSAIDICVHRLEDLQMALTLAALCESDASPLSSPTFCFLIKTHVLGNSESSPVLRTIVNLMLQDYEAALLSMVTSSPGETDCSRLDMYHYFTNYRKVQFRDHSMAAKNKKLMARLFFQVAYTHLRCGNPHICFEILQQNGKLFEDITIHLNHLKLISCLKIITSELDSENIGFENNPLAFKEHFLRWINASSSFVNSTFIRISNQNSPALESNLNYFFSTQHKRLTEGGEFARCCIDWLIANRSLLHHLLSYCKLFDCSSLICLTAVKTELILLIQKLEHVAVSRPFNRDDNRTFDVPYSFSHQICYQEVLYSPINFLRTLNQDLVSLLVNSYTSDSPVEIGEILNLTITLSSSLFQCLADYPGNYSDEAQVIGCGSIPSIKFGDLLLEMKNELSGTDPYYSKVESYFPSRINSWPLYDPSNSYSGYTTFLVEVLSTVYTALTYIAFLRSDFDLMRSLMLCVFNKCTFHYLFGGSVMMADGDAYHFCIPQTTLFDFFTSETNGVVSDKIEEFHDDAQYYSSLLKLASLKYARNLLKKLYIICEINPNNLISMSTNLFVVDRMLRTLHERLEADMTKWSGPTEDYERVLQLSDSKNILEKYHYLISGECRPTELNSSMDKLWRMLVRKKTLRPSFISNLYANINLETDEEHVRVKSQRIIDPKDGKNTLAFTFGSDLAEVEITKLLYPPTWVFNRSEYDIDLLNCILVADEYEDIPSDLQIPEMSFHDHINRFVPTIKRTDSHTFTKLCTLPNHRLYASGHANGVVKVWNWRRSKSIHHLFEPSHGSITGMKLCPYDPMKITVCDNKGFIRTSQLKHHIVDSGLNMNVHNNFRVNDFDYFVNPSTVIFVGNSNDGTFLSTWDQLMPQKMSVQTFLKNNYGVFNCVKYAAQHHYLLVAHNSDGLYILDSRTQKQLSLVRIDEGYITCVAIHQNEDYFAIGCSLGNIRIYRMADYNLVSSFNGVHSRNSMFKHHIGVTEIEFWPPGFLTSSGKDGTVRFHDIEVLSSLPHKFSIH